MTVKSKKIMNIGKDVESGGLATDPQNPKECCNEDAILNKILKLITCLQRFQSIYFAFLTWLYCTFLAVFGGFWFALLTSLVGLEDPYARLVVKISAKGFIPGKIVRIYLC